MSGKELLRKLLKDGWKEVRQEGSHHVIQKDGQTEVIPVHSNKDLPAGLLNKIMKNTGLK